MQQFLKIVCTDVCQSFPLVNYEGRAHKEAVVLWIQVYIF
jgi:hypothetical protein